MIAIAKPTVVSQPEAFRLLALKQALKLELIGMRHSSGKRASTAVRQVLKDAGRPSPRQLVPLLAEYETYITTIRTTT